MSVAFDPVQHRYFSPAGEEWPSVTRILAATGCQAAEHFTLEAAARGTDVHLACRLVDDGVEDELTLGPAYTPYLDAYRAFLAHVQPEWLLVESRVCDPLLKYAGTLDRAGTVQGQAVVVEIKTGQAIPAWTGLQTAAYRRCLMEPKRWGRYALLLTEAGRWSWTELTDPLDERVFLSALAVYQWQRQQL